MRLKKYTIFLFLVGILTFWTPFAKALDYLTVQRENQEKKL